MSSENDEANDYGHDVDLLIISHSMCVSYSMGSGCREKSIRITHVYVASKMLKTII